MGQLVQNPWEMNPDYDLERWALPPSQLLERQWESIISKMKTVQDLYHVARKINSGNPFASSKAISNFAQNAENILKKYGFSVEEGIELPRLKNPSIMTMQNGKIFIGKKHGIPFFAY